MCLVMFSRISVPWPKGRKGRGFIGVFCVCACGVFLCDRCACCACFSFECECGGRGCHFLILTVSLLKRSPFLYLLSVKSVKPSFLKVKEA